MYYCGIDIAKYKHEATVIDREGKALLGSISFANSKAGDGGGPLPNKEDNEARRYNAPRRADSDYNHLVKENRPYEIRLPK